MSLSDRVLFGRRDLSLAYDLARDYIFKNNVFRICQYEEIGDIRQLTMCNLWRIKRKPSASLEFFEYSLKRRRWEKCNSSDCRLWPIIPFGPKNFTKSLDWWESFAAKAIWKCLEESGMLSLKGYNNHITDWDDPSNLKNYEKSNIKPEMSKGKVIGILFKQCFGAKTSGSSKNKSYKKGIISRDSMKDGAKSLLHVFYKKIIDKEIASAVFSIDYANGFHDYLVYAEHAENFIKVARSHRNLLPLLKRISPEHWGRDDIFSEKLWFKKNGKETLLDKIQNNHGKMIKGQPCNVFYDDVLPLKKYCSFDSIQGWQWLSKASTVIVSKWNGIQNTPTNIAMSGFSGKAPVCAYAHILSNSGAIDNYGRSQTAQRIIFLFLSHCEKMWKEKGYRKTREWLKTSSESRISDLVKTFELNNMHDIAYDDDFSWEKIAKKNREETIDQSIHFYDQMNLGIKDIFWNERVRPFSHDGFNVKQITGKRMLAVELIKLGFSYSTHIRDNLISGELQAFSINKSGDDLAIVLLSVFNGISFVKSIDQSQIVTHENNIIPLISELIVRCDEQSKIY